MVLDLEKYKDKLSITDKDNPFLDMHKVTIDELDDLINHKLWIRIKNNDDKTISEYIDNLLYINKDNNIVIFENNKEVNFNNIIGIEDLNNNYNEGNIDFESFIGKMVKIINKDNNYIECVIQDVDDELITFAVRLVNYETLSYDLEYPINLIKNIEELNK